MKITSFEQYSAESRKTAIYPDMGNNLWYPCLGLIEEMDERATCNHDQRPYESGDVAWYIAQICWELNFDLNDIAIEAKQGMEAWMDRWDRAYISDGFIAKTAKKWHRDGPTAQRKDDFRMICEYCWLDSVFSDDYYPDLGFPDVWSILSANIAKLQDRQERGALGGDGDKR